MPELPEVETMRRGILGVCGSRIVGLRLPRGRLKPIGLSPGPQAFRRRVQGRRIDRIERRGKRVLVRLEDEAAVVIEPRMTGLVLLADPPSREHLRLGLTLAGGPHEELWYWDRRGLGSVRLFSAEQLEVELGPAKLGPDALAITVKEMRERLGKSSRAVKVALLDQQAVAGIGNLYASEMLHCARIHPATACEELAPEDWKALHREMRKVLRTAIRYEGSTLGDGTYRNALNKAGGYQNHHRVYARAGERCPTCRGGKIVRIVQAQRSTFYCPVCQPS